MCRRDLTESRACCHLQGSARRHATNLPQRRWVHWDLINRLTPTSLQRLQAFRLHICFGQSTWTEVLETLDCYHVNHAFLAHQEHFKVPAPFSGKGLFQDSSLGCTRILLIHLDYGNASVPIEKMILGSRPWIIWVFKSMLIRERSTKLEDTLMIFSVFVYIENIQNNAQN